MSFGRQHMMAYPLPIVIHAMSSSQDESGSDDGTSTNMHAIDL